MKSTLHILSSLALAAVGASMASAQAYAYTSSGVSALLYNNSAGSFGLTYASGTYYFYSAYAYGNGAYADYLGTDNISYINQFGAAQAGGPSGLAESFLESYMILGVTNFSNYTETYTAVVNTNSYAFSSVNGLGNYSSTFSYGWAYDSTYFNSGYTNGFDQYSETATHTDNIFGSGNSWFAANYTNGVFSPASGFYGGTYYSFGLNAFAYASNFTYSITVGAGQTDFVYLYAYSSKIAYSQQAVNNGTPAPAAIAPFAVGLLGAIRRRRKG